MLCYNDKTYCASNCTNEKCRIRLTETVVKEADSFGVLISMGDFSKGCYDYKKGGGSASIYK